MVTCETASLYDPGDHMYCITHGCPASECRTVSREAVAAYLASGAFRVALGKALDAWTEHSHGAYDYCGSVCAEAVARLVRENTEW